VSDFRRRGREMKQGYWYCPECGVKVPPKDVTFFETHDERSGGCEKEWCHLPSGRLPEDKALQMLQDLYHLWAPEFADPDNPIAGSEVVEWLGTFVERVGWELDIGVEEGSLRTTAVLEEARALYQTEDVEIDDTGVRMLETDDGTWVSAWVFVPKGEGE
jgi:hypothetical protein